MQSGRTGGVYPGAEGEVRGGGAGGGLSSNVLQLIEISWKSAIVLTPAFP